MTSTNTALGGRISIDVIKSFVQQALFAALGGFEVESQGGLFPPKGVLI